MEHKMGHEKDQEESRMVNLESVSQETSGQKKMGKVGKKKAKKLTLGEFLCSDTPVAAPAGQAFEGTMAATPSSQAVEGTMVATPTSQFNGSRFSLPEFNPPTMPRAMREGRDRTHHRSRVNKAHKPAFATNLVVDQRAPTFEQGNKSFGAASEISSSAKNRQPKTPDPRIVVAATTASRPSAPAGPPNKNTRVSEETKRREQFGKIDANAAHLGLGRSPFLPTKPAELAGTMADNKEALAKTLAEKAKAREEEILAAKKRPAPPQRPAELAPSLRAPGDGRTAVLALEWGTWSNPPAAGAPWPTAAEVKAQMERDRASRSASEATKAEEIREEDAPDSIKDLLAEIDRQMK